MHWGAFWQRSWGPNFNYDDEYKRQKRSYRAMKNLTAKYVGMREESEAVSIPIAVTEGVTLHKWNFDRYCRETSGSKKTKFMRHK